MKRRAPNRRRISLQRTIVIQALMRASPLLCRHVVTLICCTLPPVFLNCGNLAIQSRPCGHIAEQIQANSIACVAMNFSQPRQPMM